MKVVSIDEMINESMVDKAQFEIDFLIKKSEESKETPLIKEFVPEILALVQKFADSGQSGMSAPYTSGAIVGALTKLLAQEPLLGILNDDDEWTITYHDDDGCPLYQNKRLSSVFKRGDDGDPYYIDAIVFKGVESGVTFTSSSVTDTKGECICSSQYIKEFPFEPKTFIVDVHETEYRKDKDGNLIPEEGGGWWESIIADESQLEEVWDYYNRMERNK